jgi:hypothetical protein
MAYTFDDDDPEAFVRQAEADAAAFDRQMEQQNAAMIAAQQATDAANARAAGLANRDPNVYNPDRPSTWKTAPDSPLYESPTTLDAARAIRPGAEATSMAQQARAEALGLSPDDGRASIQARSSAADRALADQEMRAEEMAAMRAGGGGKMADKAQSALSERVRVTSPNREYPSWTKYAGTMQGDGSVSQAIGPDGQPVFQTQVVDELILGADGKPMPDPMNPQGPPLTRKVEKQVPVLQRNTGLIGEERQAALNVRGAELDREMEQTNLLAQQAMEQKRLHNDMLTTQMAQRARTEAVRKNVDEAYKGVQKATAEFAKASDVDPDRGWAEKGVGAKIAAVIASGLLGFAGRDPFAHINAVIENSIDAQKSNIAKRQAAVGEARGQQAAAVSAYDQIRAQVGDEALADDAYRLSALETIKSQALAKLQNANVKVLDANAQAFMNGLDQQIAEKTRAIELKSATTPATITRSVSPLNSDERWAERERFKAGLKAQTEGSADAIGYVAKRQEQERGIQGDISKEKAKVDAAGINPENRRMIAKETAIPNRVRQLAQDLVKLGTAPDGSVDIPGVGWYIPGLGAAEHQVTARARRFKKLTDELNQYNIVDLTGAVSSEKQDKILESLTSDSEEERMQGYLDLSHAMDVHINTIEGADPAAAAAIREHTNKGLAGWRGGDVANPTENVVEDE